MSPKERNQLIDALIDDDITDADFIRLEAEMSVDPAVRQAYYERLELSVFLETSLEGKVVEMPQTAEPRRWSAWGMSAMGIAAAVALVSGIFLGGRFVDPAESPLVESHANGFGVLVGQVDAQWADSFDLNEGDLVPSGPLRLVSGIVQIELFSGVSVVVEGDADFEIHSPMDVSMLAGKLRARVPEAAQGFRVRSTEGDVVDLGTEFAINVTDGLSEVHVLDGEVEWHPKMGRMHHLDGGEAVNWTKGGELEVVNANEAAFVGVEEVGERRSRSRLSQMQRWMDFSTQLQQDPRLVAYYQMGSSNRWSRRLANISGQGAGKVGEGAVVAATPASDRWGRLDQALDFSPTGSRVRLVVPDEYRSMTFLTWVKINSLDRWYNSLFLTDGHDLHEPHWQILNDGRLFFSVKKYDDNNAAEGRKAKHNFHSPSFWDTSLSGQWLMIATVYDVDARAVTHYVNGDAISREQIPDEYLVETVKIGAASIGNWGQPYSEDPAFTVRNLNGSMDEFAFFAAALSDDEIAEIYQHGKP
ncbi:MAG: hypothetical protein SynsKO_13310 [Synoicihabitans sp.]